MSNITRRTALATAAAAITTGVVTTTLASKAALAADPVIALAEQHRAASKAWFAAIDIYEDAADRVGFNICYGEGLVTVETPDGTCIWGASEIRAAAEDGRQRHKLTPKQRDAALAKLKWLKTDAARTRRELGIEPLYREREHWNARFWELQERLLDTTATTPHGVLAKLRGFYHDDEIAGIMAGEEPDDLPGDYAASIYRDLERLAGEVSS
jgi:hypothetical protein